MAETIRLSVQVKTEEEARRLEQAIAQLRSAGGGAAGPRPGVTPRAVSPAEKVAENLGRAVGATIRAPFDVAKGTARIAETSLLTFLGPLGRLGAAAATTAPTAVAFGLVVVAFAAPLAAFTLTLKLMRLSFGWAEEAADAELKILARTKRTFPQLIGDAFSHAEDTILVKLGLASALFGQSADALATSITKRIGEAQMQRGLRGEKDIFARWGITPDTVQVYEQIKGERIGLTDWLELFIKKREEFDVAQASSKGTPAEAAAVRGRNQLISDGIKIFGQRFADILGAFTSEDVQRLKENIAKTVPLVAVEDADQKARDFAVALKSLKETFSQIKHGVAGDLMPAYSQMMDEVRGYLLSTGDDGQTMGMQFRKLASSIALHGWKTLSILLEEVDPEGVKKFIDKIKDWHPEETITNLHKAAQAVAGFADWVEATQGRFRKMRKGATIARAERAAMQAQGGAWNQFKSWLPPFIPGAPGYERIQREQAKQEEEYRRSKAGLPPSPAPTPPPPPAAPPAAGVPSGVAAPSNAAAGPLQIAPGYRPILSREDPRVMDALAKAQAFLPPGYTARATSGFRGGSRTSQHITGTAIDIQIYDDKGRPIRNQGPDVTGLYTRYARAAYGFIIDRHPELKGRFAWGGAFGTSSARPWNPDLMHFDIGGQRGRILQYRLDRLGPLRAGNAVTAAVVPQPATVSAGRAVIPPELQTPENMAALKEVGEKFGISPMAIAGVINTESKWRTGASTGSYRGLTQIGPENPEWATIGSMSVADQIRTYGRWLDRYRFREKTSAAGINFAAMSPAQQAAYLQGFQFAPNAMSWQYAAGRGEFGVRTTASRQARVLGSTTLTEMTRYYQGLLAEDTARLTAKPPAKVIQEGTAAGEAAARAFKEGIEDVKIPLKSLSEDEKEREKRRADREVLSI